MGGLSGTLPAGLTAASLSGAGWTCVLDSLTCTRTDVLDSGASYPPLTLTVDIASNAPKQVTNTAAITGGGTTATSSIGTATTTVKHAATRPTPKPKPPHHDRPDHGRPGHGRHQPGPR
ncbi:hypothetical protein ABZ532_24275 [Streptomyces sp. NPDC019396]|uniref:hypothetical protein n=1 Tax=Streptomyces sp. NPDC019396 TaxID=3154687 RepID=UPI0033E56488